MHRSGKCAGCAPRWPRGRRHGVRCARDGQGRAETSVRLTRQQRQIAVIAAILAIAVAGGGFAAVVGVFDQGAQQGVYDQLITFAPSPPKERVVVVGMDDETIRKYGRWPLPRRAYADALRVLREAKPSVIAFDVAFYEPSDRAEDDRALADEIRAAGNVILAAQGVGSGVAGSGVLTYRELQLPVPVLREAAAELASVDVTPDRDARLRRAYLVLTDGTRRYYNLAFLAALRQLRVDPAKVREVPQGYAFPFAGQERVVPTDQGGDMRIYYTAGPATPLQDQIRDALGPCSKTSEICVVSMAHVIEGKIPQEIFRTRIVLIGAHSASGVPDNYPVPTSEAAKMWGVEVWANGALTILSGRFPVLREGPLPTLLWLTIVTLLGAILIVRFRLLGFFMALGVLVAYALIATVVFALRIQLVAAGVVEAPSIAYVAAGAPFWWVVIVAYLMVEEQAAVRRTQRAFGLAVTPAVARHILELEDRGGLALGGQLREATVMFGDIRGFTTMSEGMGPAELMATLNRYFDGMVKIVERYQGTVNKYNGDNIMVIWGAPIDDRDHASRAVRCALELQQFIVVERAKGGPDVAFGFGINSGPLVAGLLGAEGRFEYTVIGDTVNVASRLTSGDIAKRDNVAISEATLRLLRDDVERVDLGQVQVKGRAEPVHCFQVNRFGVLATPNPAPAPLEPIRAAVAAGYH